MRVAIDVAQQIAHAVAPAMLALAPVERAVESAILGAVASAISDEVIDALAATLRDLEGAEGAVKEIMGGDIAAIPLAEILQVLQMQRQTGVVHVSNARSAVTISLRQGLVDFVQSRGAAEEYRLGRYFVEKGLVTRSQLDQVILTKGMSGPLLGDVLVDSGQVSREDLNEALAKQSSELIYEILRWPYGRFSFTREPFRPEAEAAKLGLGVSGLVLEGFRRVDEWRLMEGTINFDQVIVLDQFALESVSPLKLTRIDKLVLGAVDGVRTVNDIIKESAVSSFDAIKCVYQFLQSRVLRPRGA
jgi:hypothetical protein